MLTKFYKDNWNYHFYQFLKKLVSKNFIFDYRGFIKNKQLKILRKNFYSKFALLEIIYEFSRHFWPKSDFRAISWDYHIMKIDKSKNVSGYGLYKYIDEEKRVKKNYRKNGMTPFRGIGRISTLRPFFGHFHIIKSDKSKNYSEYGLYKYIGEEKKWKKELQKKWHVTTTYGVTYPIDQNFQIFDWL